MSTLEEKVRNFLLNNWDVTFDNLVKEIDAAENDFPEVNRVIEKMLEEGVIIKGSYPNNGKYVTEYSPVEEAV